MAACVSLQVPGWEDRGLGGSSSESQQAAQQLSEDLEAYGDPSELETLGETGGGVEGGLVCVCVQQVGVVEWHGWGAVRDGRWLGWGCLGGGEGMRDVACLDLPFHGEVRHAKGKASDPAANKVMLGKSKDRGQGPTATATRKPTST